MLYHCVAQILKSLQEAEHELQRVQSAPRGRLKISVPTVLGRKVVLPALRDFQVNFPEVTIDIRLDDTRVDVIEQDFDLVLRLGDLEDSGLQARSIGPHAFITCASPAYLKQYGTPVSVEDLHAHSCIHYRFPTTERLENWAFTGVQPVRPVKPAIVLNDGEALASAALAGLGIVQVPDYLVKDAVAAGRLQPVLAGDTASTGNIWLLLPPRCAGIPRVRAFIDFIAEWIPQQLAM